MSQVTATATPPVTVVHTGALTATTTVMTDYISMVLAGVVGKNNMV